MTDADNVEKELSEVRKRLLTLEWDKKHNQLNAGMESHYEELKTKCKELESMKEKLK
ncbi:hypothetical protein JXB11_01305 [Candidatus Woesearchaeota archaeon]|nr:hypothetical protein [Candidatus Woesearchaeota archaeon]